MIDDLLAEEVERLNSLEPTFEDDMKLIDTVYQNMAMNSPEGIAETIQRFQEDEAYLYDKYFGS